MSSFAFFGFFKNPTQLAAFSNTPSGCKSVPVAFSASPLTVKSAVFTNFPDSSVDSFAFLENQAMQHPVHPIDPLLFVLIIFQCLGPHFHDMELVELLLMLLICIPSSYGNNAFSAAPKPN